MNSTREYCLSGCKRSSNKIVDHLTKELVDEEETICSREGETSYCFSPETIRKYHKTANEYINPYTKNSLLADKENSEIFNNFMKKNKITLFFQIFKSGEKISFETHKMETLGDTIVLAFNKLKIPYENLANYHVIYRGKSIIDGNLSKTLSELGIVDGAELVIIDIVYDEWIKKINHEWQEYFEGRFSPLVDVMAKVTENDEEIIRSLLENFRATGNANIPAKALDFQKIIAEKIISETSAEKILEDFKDIDPFFKEVIEMATIKNNEEYQERLNLLKNKIESLNRNYSY